MTLAALSFALVVHPQEAYALHWQPRKGEAHVYEYFVTGDDFAIEASIQRAVTEVSGEGAYTVRSRSLGAIVRTAGAESKDERPNESSATYDAFGRLGEIKGGSAGLAKYRSALLTSFVSPPAAVKPGDKWSSERAKDRPRGLAASSADYTFRGVRDGLAEVAFVFGEKGGDAPQTATGTWWVDAKSGLPVKFEAKVTNFLGEKGDVDVRLVLRRPA